MGPREPRIGIDTIHLCTAKWRQRQGQPLPWRRIGRGREVIRFSCYSVVRNSHGYLSICFSPQILLFGPKGRCNTKTLSIRMIRQAVLRLEKLLVRDGIHADLFSAAIQRLDLFCDLPVSKGFSHTVAALMRIRLPHLHAPRKFRGETSDTLYYSNKSREICVYDKAQELIDKRILSPREALLRNFCPDRTVRVECRLRSPRSVRSSLGFGTLGAFLKNRRVTQVLEQVYNHVTFPIRQVLKHSRELRFPTSPAFRGTFPVSSYSYLSQKRSKSMKTLDPGSLNGPLRLEHLYIFSMFPPRGPPKRRDVWGRECPKRRGNARKPRPLERDWDGTFFNPSRLLEMALNFRLEQKHGVG